MLYVINITAPAVFALMNYWTLDGWLKLQSRLKEPDAPLLTQTVFLGVE